MHALLTSNPHQVFVPTVEAPRFYRGYRAGLAASLALSAWLPVVMWFTRRQERHEKTRNPQQAGCEAETTDYFEEFRGSGLFVSEGNHYARRSCGTWISRMHGLAAWFERDVLLHVSSMGREELSANMDF